jgi:hypothetical protein
MIVLSGMSFTVKNTFIDSESDEYESTQRCCRQERRARTCIGKLVSLAAEDLVESADTAPPILRAHTHANVSLSNDKAKLASSATSQGFSFIVKNTFIEVKDAETRADPEFNGHHPGVCTCRASFEKVSPRFIGADDTVSTNANDSDLSDIEGFDSTPFDDSPYCHALDRMCFPPSVPTLSLCNSLSFTTSTTAGSSIIKTCCHWKNKGFCKLGQTCKFAHPAQKQGVGSAQQKKRDQTIAPLMPPPQPFVVGIGLVLPSSADAEKSDKTCCHWKNKGWCKYKDTCKFQHPAHKQGVGSSKRK